MKTWVGYAFVSTVFAGLTSVIAKLGLQGIAGETGLAIRTATVFVLLAGYSAFAVGSAEWSKVGPQNLVWLGLSGLTTSLSWLFYYKALQEGDVSTVALIDKGSLVVALLFAALFLGETLTWRKAAGAALILAGLLVVAQK